MSDLESPNAFPSINSILISSGLKQKTIKESLKIIFEHLDYNEGRNVKVLNLSITKKGDENWLGWIADEGLPDKEFSDVPVYEGGFVKWPKFSQEYFDQLKDFFANLQSQEADLLIVMDNFDSESKSCLSFCELADQVFVLVEEGRTSLRDLNKVGGNLSKLGVKDFSTIMIRKKNAILNWVSELLT